MPVINGYTTLATLKARLRVSQAEQDATLEQLITASSRAIDRWTARRFYGVAETRVYTPAGPTRLLIDDAISVSALATDEDGDRVYETSWSASQDYYLEPANAALDGEPVTAIAVDPANGRYAFPLAPRSAQLTGSFGYCASGSHPAPVEEACLRLATRLYKLADAPLGVAGSAEMGLIRISQDRDLQDLLWPYRRVQGVA